jgi:hypothetical protein
MAVTPHVLANRLREEGDRVVEFFNNLTQDQWGMLIYPQKSNWSMHHLLAHFVSSEIGRSELIDNVYNRGNGAPNNFEIDSFNQLEVAKFSCESTDDLIIRFIQERNHLIEHVSGMTPLDLERVGNDPYLGEVALTEMIKLTYRHLQIHLRDARRCL